MKKLLAMLAIVFVSAGSTQSWAIVGLGDLKFDGSLEVRGNSANNESDFGGATAAGTNDHRGSTATRLRVGANLDVVENVQGRLELVRMPRQYGTAATTVAGEEATLAFHNAYIEFANLWSLNVRLGRQYTGDPGDLVWNISPRSDDSLTTASIDGLRVKRSFGNDSSPLWDIYAFTGKASGTENAGIAQTDNTVASGDVNLNVLHTNWYLIPGGKIGAGILYGVDNNTVITNDNNKLGIFRVGASGGVSNNLITYRAEFLQNFGKFNGAGSTAAGDDLKYKGNAIDLGVGFNSAASGEAKAGFGLWGNYVRGSGDSSANNEDKSFRDFASFGIGSTSDRYFGEIFGKSNTLSAIPFGQGIALTGNQNTGFQVMNIGGQFTPSAWEGKYWARADYFNFRRSKSSGTNGKKLGNEIDLTLGYNHSENVWIEGGYAWLDPDDSLTGTGNKQEEVTKWFARANLKWGERPN